MENMRVLKPAEAWEVIKRPDGEPKTIHCKLCGDLLFEWDADHLSSKDIWVKGVEAHYEIQHSLTMIWSFDRR